MFDNHLYKRMATEYIYDHAILDKWIETKVQ